MLYSCGIVTQRQYFVNKRSSEHHLHLAVLAISCAGLQVSGGQFRNDSFRVNKSLATTEWIVHCFLYESSTGGFVRMPLWPHCSFVCGHFICWFTKLAVKPQGWISGSDCFSCGWCLRDNTLALCLLHWEGLWETFIPGSFELSILARLIRTGQTRASWEQKQAPSKLEEESVTF